MRDQKISISLLFGLVVIPILIFLPPAYSQDKSKTERECALTEGAEVIWDLRVYQWVCCIPKGEYLEDCVSISDKAPLPKTSMKPLPQKGSGAIIEPQDSQNQVE